MQTASEYFVNGCSPPLISAHLDALLKRGLTPSTIQAAGLRSASADEVRAFLKFNPSNSAGIAIPFSHPRTAETRIVRVRPDVAPVLDGKPAKYLSPKGAGNLLYFPPGCAGRLKDPTESLHLTEGEFKCLVAWQAGLLAVGLIGVWGWRGKGLNGHSQPVNDLDFIAWRERIVVIVFDSDAAINPDVQRARYALAMEAYRRGAKVVYSVNLPSPDGVKVGWDDYLLANGVEAFHNLDLEAISSPYPRVKVWTLSELRAANIERPAARVPGWGVREKGKVILTGAGGKGKTTLLLQSSIHLAAATPLFGHPQLTVCGGPHRVLLYLAEDPIAEVRFRLLKQIEELGYGPEVEERIHILDFGDRRPQLLTDEWALQILADQIRQQNASIVILDPLVSLHDRDENSNPQMRAVLDAVTPISEETGCVFIIAHHEPKSPESNGAASRGASAIRDWCRTMLRLTAQKPGSDSTQRLQLDLDKVNYGGTVHSLTLERKQDSYLFATVEPEAAVTPKDIWELLGPDGGWFDEVQARIIEQFRVSKTTAYRAMKKAEALGCIAAGERTNPATNRQKSYLTRGSGQAG